MIRRNGSQVKSPSDFHVCSLLIFPPSSKIIEDDASTNQTEEAEQLSQPLHRYSRFIEQSPSSAMIVRTGTRSMTSRLVIGRSSQSEERRRLLSTVLRASHSPATTTTTTTSTSISIPCQFSIPGRIATSIDSHILSLRKRHVAVTVQRTLVTVTKTKVAGLLTDDENDHNDKNTYNNKNDGMSSLSSTPTYITQSESLLVTPSCLKRVETLIQQRQSKDQAVNGTEQQHKQPGKEEDYFLRVFVDAGGCSGFQYQFEINNDLDNEEDVVVVSATSDSSSSAAASSSSSSLRPRVVIDKTSLGYLNGATLDYVIEMIKSSFVVRDNPKSESACGCGSSFALKNFSVNPAQD